MSNYIKKEDAIKAIARYLSPIFERAEEGATRVLSDIPSADVVEVVRCKDCKYHEELLNNNDENVLCWVHDIDVIVDRNGYCNYGERKEQEHGTKDY